MAQLIVRTAGESHGPALVTFIEGLPAGLPVDPARIDADMLRRQGGYGRGGRQRIEQDHVEILSGLRLDDDRHRRRASRSVRGRGHH